MIKHYCDVCKKEIKKNYVDSRLTCKLGRVKCEVAVAIDDRWNGGDICLDCLKKVIEEGNEWRG